MTWGQNEQGLTALVLQELEQAGVPLRAPEVAQLVGLPHLRVQMILANLWRTDRLQRLGSCKNYHYRVPVRDELPALGIEPTNVLRAF